MSWPFRPRTANSALAPAKVRMWSGADLRLDRLVDAAGNQPRVEQVCALAAIVRSQALDACRFKKQRSTVVLAGRNDAGEKLFEVLVQGGTALVPPFRVCDAGLQGW